LGATPTLGHSVHQEFLRLLLTRRLDEHNGARSDRRVTLHLLPLQRYPPERRALLLGVELIPLTMSQPSALLQQSAQRRYPCFPLSVACRHCPFPFPPRAASAPPGAAPIDLRCFWDITDMGDARL